MSSTLYQVRMGTIVQTILLTQTSCSRSGDHGVSSHRHTQSWQQAPKGEEGVACSQPPVTNNYSMVQREAPYVGPTRVTATTRSNTSRPFYMIATIRNKTVEPFCTCATIRENNFKPTHICHHPQ